MTTTPAPVPPAPSNGALYTLWGVALGGLILGVWWTLGDPSAWQMEVLAGPMLLLGSLALVGALMIHALAWIMRAGAVRD